MASMVRAASWKTFNLEKDREGLGISTLFGTLVLTIFNLMSLFVPSLREGSQSSYSLQPVGIGRVVGKII